MTATGGCRATEPVGLSGEVLDRLDDLAAERGITPELLAAELLLTYGPEAIRRAIAERCRAEAAELGITLPEDASARRQARVS